MRFWSQVLCIAMMSVSLSVAADAAGKGTWKQGSSMETARSNFGAAALNGEIYVAGGASISGPLSTFEVYDPIGDHWRPLPALPEGRERFGMAAADGYIYLSGGFGPEGLDPMDDFWVYDPYRSQWRQIEEMPEARAAHDMISVGGRLYVVGGTGTDAQKVFVYTPQTRTWSTAPWSLPEARQNSAVVTIGDKIYVLGGLAGGEQLDSVVVIDTKAGTVDSGPDMPRARAGHTAAVLKNRIHVVGGTAPQAARTYPEHDRFDPMTGKWATDVPMPTARYGLVSAAVRDTWYVIGGGAGSGFFTVFTEADIVEKFEPGSE